MSRLTRPSGAVLAGSRSGGRSGMSRTQPEREASVFRKPAAPPERAPARRGPEARGDRTLVIPTSISSSLSQTVREQLAYLTPDQQRAFLSRDPPPAPSP